MTNLKIKAIGCLPSVKHQHTRLPSHSRDRTPPEITHEVSYNAPKLHELQVPISSQPGKLIEKRENAQESTRSESLH
jgi:hypothetical protein